MNIKVPTRVVSGTGNYTQTTVLQGRWQEHTSSGTKSGTKNITMSGTWGTPTFSGTSNVWQLDIDVPASPTWSGTTVKSWTSDDMEYGHLGYISTATLTDRGTVPSGASIRINIDPDRLSLSVTIFARQTIRVEPTTITLSVTTRSSCTWTASDTWTIDVSEENAYIASVSYVSGAPRAALSHSRNIVTARWSSSSYRSGTVSNIVKVTYNYPVTTLYWAATDSYTLSDTGATITKATYVTGTQPSDVSYRGRTITLSWYSSTEPSGTVAGATMILSYSAPYSNTYANVYFNGTRVNYVYFNGTRYP